MMGKIVILTFKRVNCIFQMAVKGITKIVEN